MPQSSGARVYKYKNIAAALAILLLIMVAVNTSCNSHFSKKRRENKATVNSTAAENDSTADTDDGSFRFTRNYKFEELRNDISLHEGKLCIVSNEHPFTGNVTDPDTLYGYMFDQQGNMVMSASFPNIQGNASALKNLNSLCCDFGKKTGLYTLMVNSILPPEDDQAKFNESSLGTCFDLMIYDQAIGYYDTFKAEGDYEWIKNNCYKFGFVIRGDSVLRYVGRPVSAYICDQSITAPYDLDKFQEDIKNYTFEEPLMFTDEDSCEYAFYFVPADGSNSITKVPVPLREDDSPYSYEISGNNADGYIVCVDLIGSAGFGEDTSSGDTTDNMVTSEVGDDSDAIVFNEDFLTPVDTGTGEFTE